MKRRMFWFDDANDETLTAIQKHFQCKTKSQTLRMALENYANSLGLPRDHDLNLIRKHTAAHTSRTKHNGGSNAASEDTGTTHEQPVDILTALLELSKTVQLDLPEDYSERLDDYLYGEFRRSIEGTPDVGEEKRE